MSDDDLIGPSHGGLTRRGLLVLGGCVATVGLGGYGLSQIGNESVVRTPAVLSGGYPRVLAFRQSETLTPQKSYADWGPTFAPFRGIIGKALAEERSDRPKVLEYFNRFKQQYPAKLVLLHHNGRGRLPSFETKGWSAGWWLYRAGSTLTAVLDAQDSTLQVASLSPFSLARDRFGNRGDDIVIAARGSDGKPDFSVAEQVRLSAINRSATSLTVRRGRYGTVPLSFPTGAYVAPHVSAGPWSEVDDRVWFYNLTDSCPPDPDGRRVLDVLLEQFAAWFGPEGSLAAFDGLQLDVFLLDREKRDRVDADCDGVVDLARRDGVDTYLQGQIALTSGLRKILGPQRYLITDGNVGQEPDSDSVNGVELEGFPTSEDYGITLWSQALMTLDLWRRHGSAPRLSYPVYIFKPPNDDPVSFRRFRLALAAALATDSAVTWGNEPASSQTSPNDGVFIWDEFVAGTAATAGWLGAPRGDTIHLAEHEPDLFAGEGVAWTNALVQVLVGRGVRFSAQSTAGGMVLVVSRQEPTPQLSFTIPDRALPGPDVVVAVDLAANRRTAYPGTIGRQCTVTVTGSGGSLPQTVTVPTTFFHVVLGYHGIGPGPIQITFTVEGDTPLRLRGLRVFAAPDAIAREFTRGAVFANPSGRDVTFDVAALFPGRRFARIVGSLGQDSATNDGSRLGPTLTLRDLDALLVLAD